MGSEMCIRDRVQAFLDAVWAERGLSENTLDSYAQDLKHFSKFAAQHVNSFSEITIAQLQAYLNQLFIDGMSSSTAARRVSCFRQFFKWAVSVKVMTEDPTALLVTPQQSQHLPNALSESDVEALLAVDTKIRLGLRDKALSLIHI